MWINLEIQFFFLFFSPFVSNFCALSCSLIPSCLFYIVHHQRYWTRISCSSPANRLLSSVAMCGRMFMTLIRVTTFCILVSLKTGIIIMLAFFFSVQAARFVGYLFILLIVYTLHMEPANVWNNERSNRIFAFLQCNIICVWGRWRKRPDIKISIL